MGKEITYPIFLEVAKYAEDHFWRCLFEEMAYEKTPYGCYMSKGFLNCSFKGKEFSYKIQETEDPQVLYNDIITLLKEKLGIYSSSDKLRRIQDFAKMEDEIKEMKNSKWAGIKKKTSKDFIIENYVIEMKNKYKLSDIKAKQLLGTIMSGLIFKVYTPKDIVYENGRIHHIEGIDFFEGGFDTRHLIEMGSCTPVIIIPEKISLKDVWFKKIGYIPEDEE
jgi:hypothetical protein